MSLNPDSVFFITGAANGIGLETAKLVVRQGHRAVLADIDYENAVEAAQDLGEQAMPVALDVRVNQDWSAGLTKARDHFGQVDILVNNAGVMHPGFLMDQLEEAIREMMEVNFWGLAGGLRAGARFFLDQGHGHLITLGSMASFVSLKGQAFYSATKHAVRSLHYAFTQELADSPIRFSIVHPGSTETGMLAVQEGVEAAVLSFAEPTLQPGRIAEAIYQVAERDSTEVIIPPFKGFFSRILGVFPGLLSRALASQWARGRQKMRQRLEVSGERETNS